MPRIIVKCRYYKNTKKGNLGGLVKYIATREGVEKLPKETRLQPATDNQNNLIQQLISRVPSLKSMLEYKVYLKEKNYGAASEFIAAAVENNTGLLNDDSYLRYMATRPRVEKISGSHGLFSDDDKELDLEQEIAKLESHTGNVYSVIISLKREDAQRLGYNTAKRWKDLICAQIGEVADAHHIPRLRLKWYGAFHNESHHPHVHLLLYSTAEEDKSFLTKKGIDHLRRVFGTEIFKDEIREIYDEQTEIRNKLTAEMRLEFNRLVNAIRNGEFINEDLLSKIEELARRLSNCSGKMQYGYLPKGVKSLVDEIVDDLSKDERVCKLYDLWYQAKCRVYGMYTDAPPEKKPLSQENAFKPIRNALVYEAARPREELTREPENESDRVVQTGPGKSQELQMSAQRSQERKSSTNHKNRVMGAALRFGRTLACVFEENFKQYGSDDDDIDKKLRREIQAVKNGQNLVL